MRAKALIIILLCWCGSVFAASFSDYVVESVRTMPQGGGYASDRAAERRLAAQGIVWQGASLRISPQGAAPTFCSAACYMVFLQALQRWAAAHPERPFSRSVWHSLRVEAVHPDGYLSWGRANSNGPGFAKWVCDLGAGVNFSSVNEARPGDFLKFFHTSEIGSAERGHMVIYLGRYEGKHGSPGGIIYWSSNSPTGYGVRKIELGQMHHPIFTRITRPEAFAAAPQLPPSDAWLGSMLSQRHSYENVVSKCRIKR